MQDKVTKSLQNLTTEIVRIKGTRTGKAMLRARRDESKILQILTAEYLREKGAPKVSGSMQFDLMSRWEHLVLFIANCKWWNLPVSILMLKMKDCGIS